jgi:hypothetical protein
VNGFRVDAEPSAQFHDEGLGPFHLIVGRATARTVRYDTNENGPFVLTWQMIRRFLSRPFLSGHYLAIAADAPIADDEVARGLYPAG